MSKYEQVHNYSQNLELTPEHWSTTIIDFSDSNYVHILYNITIFESLFSIVSYTFKT